MSTWVGLCWAICVLCSAPVAAYEISSYAAVNADGSLRISGKTVHLYGIYIPETNRTCSRNRNPRVCGSRAVVALNFKIDGFVRCEILKRYDDGSVAGRCRVKASHFDDGEDLSAYLLQKGWAVALPDGPFEYQTLEKIARSRQFGIWGTTVDNIVRPQIPSNAALVSVTLETMTHRTPRVWAAAKAGGQ